MLAKLTETRSGRRTQKTDAPQPADLLLAFGLIAGLLWTPLLMCLPLAALLRTHRTPIQWKSYHYWFLASTLIGTAVVANRGAADGGGLILQYSFIWSVPFIFLFYRPDQWTVRIVGAATLALFATDFLFNVLGSANGADLLGRTMDAREGTLGARMGGIFGHAFYSGSISISALAILLCSKRQRIWIWLPIVNLLLAGSWRLTVAVPIILFYYLWKKRSSWAEYLSIILISAAAIFATTYSSGLLDNGAAEVNESNTLRVFAWLSAIEKISESPINGVGYPKDNTLDGINTQTIDDSLTAESWYLGAAITFGVPYALTRLAAIALLLFNRNRSEFIRIAAPFIMIDLVYGGFFEGTLFYVLLWTNVAATAIAEHAATPAKQRSEPRRPRKPRKRRQE